MTFAWNSGSEFIAMGGHGFFVWGSFAATAVAMLAEVVALGAARRALKRDHIQSGESDAVLEER